MRGLWMVSVMYNSRELACAYFAVIHGGVQRVFNLRMQETQPV
jgi:hypothetical protein